MSRTTRDYPSPRIILSTSKLREAWDSSRDRTKRPAAPGIDQVTADQFKKNLNGNITSINEHLSKGTYFFEPLYPHYVEKKGSDKLRLICIPTVRDRLVQRAIHHYLVQKDRLDLQQTKSVDYGFRKNLNTDQAISAAIRLRSNHGFALRADIVSFFDRIDRKLLSEALRRKLGHHSLVPLLNQIIRCDIPRQHADDAKEKAGIQPGRGLRQGMPLSPILSSFVLRDFDKAIMRAGLPMVRYADDFVVFVDSLREAHSAKKLVNKELKKIGHAIHDIGATGSSKATIVSPDKPIEFLGMEIYMDADGRYDRRITAKAFKRARDAMNEAADINELVKQRKTVWDAAQKMDRIMQGYNNSYTNARNLSDYQSAVERYRRDAHADLLTQIIPKDVFRELSRRNRTLLGLPDES